MTGLAGRSVVRYERRFFVFIDVLGFAELIEESERDTTKILRIYQLLDRAKSMTQLPVSHNFEHLRVDLTKFRSNTFSDTITMSCPSESFDYLNAIVTWVTWYQYFMWAEEGVFVRGAIVHGDIYDEERSSIVFGPAMVTAYRLETKRARWPRILIDSSVLEKLPDHKWLRAHREYVTKDSAGNCYLDYLHELFIQTCFDKGRRLSVPSDAVALLHNHKSAVETAVARIQRQHAAPHSNDTRKRRLLDKYNRLSRYHNSVVDRLRRVALKLEDDSDLIRSITSEVMAHGLLRELGYQQYLSLEPKFTAENLKYVDIMPVLGMAVDKVVEEHKHNENLAGDDPMRVIDFFCSNLPAYLGSLQKTLDGAMIDAAELSSNRPW